MTFRSFILSTTVVFMAFVSASGSCGTVSECYLVNLKKNGERKVMDAEGMPIGMSGITYDPTESVDSGWSLFCETSGSIDYVKYYEEEDDIDMTQYDYPWWANGDNSGSFINRLDQLSTCGKKVITAKFFTWSNGDDAPCYETTLKINAVCPNEGMKKLSVQELQSPPGPRHSDGIIYAPSTGIVGEGSNAGFVTFANELVVPGTGGFDGGQSAGTQTGHCVEVWTGTQLACYFNFDLKTGRILAEALFDLTNFPNAELTITGGTGAYMGIVGSGKTRPPEVFDGTTFFYDFEYKILH